MRRSDEIAILEHACHLTLSPAQWLETMHRRFVGRLDQGFGVSIGSWAVAGPAFQFVEQSPLYGGAHPLANQAMGEVVGGLSPAQRSRFYGPGACAAPALKRRCRCGRAW